MTGHSEQKYGNKCWINKIMRYLVEMGDLPIWNLIGKAALLTPIGFRYLFPINSL